MCGIGGLLQRTLSHDLDTVGRRLRAALSHRGPNGYGVYVSPQHDALLIHTRLAILDLRPVGDQPMERNGYRIVFNGEIYNFRALRQELIHRGEIFRTETDTEVLLALYLREGPSCLAQLRGMFAFAIWNESEGTCFLARDRFGIKPLYFALLPAGDLLFASEVKALLATDLIPRKLSPSGLESFLAFGSVAEPHTLVADIQSLEAGHWMLWQSGQLTKHPYYEISFAPSETSAASASPLVRSALLDSVRHHFVSDVPVSIFLSGGLDSTALVALAREAGQAGLTTFSLGVENASQDESAAARMTAEIFGTQHYEMLLTGELARHWVEDFLAALDQPTVDGFNTYCVSKLASDHGFKVVLSGLGGDEFFGGYPSFQQVPRLLQLGRQLQPAFPLTRSLARFCQRHATSSKAARLADYLGGESTLIRAYEATRSIFTPAERSLIGSALIGFDSHQSSASNDSQPSWSSLPDAVSVLEITRYMRNQLLRDADVMSMAHGLELRVPFVDHVLFETLRTIPASTRLSSGKELLRSCVPGLSRTKAGAPKLGFTLPMGSWLETTWCELKQELRGAPALRLDSWARSWSLIVLSRWLRRHGFSGWSR